MSTNFHLGPPPKTVGTLLAVPIDIESIQAVSHLMAAPAPEKVRKAELDELYTFVGKKKTKSIS